MSRCDQETCPMWDGDGCPCDRFGLDRGDLPTDGVFTVGADTYDPDMTDDLEGDGFGLDQL